MTRTGARLLTIVLCALPVLACERTEAPAPQAELPAAGPAPAPAPVAFATDTLSIVTGTQQIRMPVEIADREDLRAFGLMDRAELAPDAGMIFLYADMQPAGSGFWMYRTRIPLDIAFFDGAGRIVAIQQMMPCVSLDATRCPPYSPGVPFFGAVEANRGFFARHGIGVGDTVVLPGRIGG